jgi:hypothetical protein
MRGFLLAEPDHADQRLACDDRAMYASFREFYPFYLASTAIVVVDGCTFSGRGW